MGFSAWILTFFLWQAECVLRSDTGTLKVKYCEDFVHTLSLIHVPGG